MVRKPFDLEANHPLYPRREILEEYKKVGFEYEKQHDDRPYEEWYALVKGRQVTQEVSQIYRKKVTGEGEFLMYNLHLRGTDWKGNPREFDTLWGRYSKPIFMLEKDPATQNVTSTQISSHETIHDVPFSKQKLEELLEMSTEPISLVVYGSANRRYGIQSIEDFLNADHDDLVMCGNKGKSLESVIAEKNQFTYEKRATKTAYDKAGSASSSTTTTTNTKDK
jgi:hypothetical protein